MKSKLGILKGALGLSVIFIYKNVKFLILVFLLFFGVKITYDLIHPIPDAHDKSIIYKRHLAEESLENQFEFLSRDLAYPIIANSSDDVCSRGQNNWKVRDGYKSTCSIVMTTFYGVPNDFIQGAKEMDIKLSSNGWIKSDGDTVEKLIRDYLQDSSDFNKSNRSGLAPLDRKALKYKYSRYKNDIVQIELRFIDKNNKELDSLNAQQTTLYSYQPFYVNSRIFDLRSHHKYITQDYGFVIMATAGLNYYRK